MRTNGMGGIGLPIRVVWQFMNLVIWCQIPRVVLFSPLAGKI